MSSSLARTGIILAALAYLAGHAAFADESVVRAAPSAADDNPRWPVEPIASPPPARSRASALARIDRRKWKTQASILIPASLFDSLPAKAVANSRKISFIETTLPLILYANQVILRDRRRIEILHIYEAAGVPLVRKDAAWLERIAKRHGLAKVDYVVLLRRVDIVPPSLALAQAAEESGWGVSRFARRGKALFGQKVFRGGEGLVPLERPDGERYRVRSFDRVIDGVRAYLHNLNTHYAYAQFRRVRAGMRRENGTLDSYGLAGTLLKYSERREAYLETIREIMQVNGLTVFDRLQPGA